MRILAVALALLLVPVLGRVVGLMLSGVRLAEAGTNGTVNMTTGLLSPVDLWRFAVTFVAAILAASVVLILAGALKWVREA